MTDWLTTTDIAKQIGVKVRTIYKYRERDTLPIHDAMIGNKPVWRQTTIDEWISERDSNELEIQ